MPIHIEIMFTHPRSSNNYLMSSQWDDVQEHLFFPLAHLEDKLSCAFGDQHDVLVCNFHLKGFFKLKDRRIWPCHWVDSPLRLQSDIVFLLFSKEGVTPLAQVHFDVRISHQATAIETRTQLCLGLGGLQRQRGSRCVHLDALDKQLSNKNED